MDIVTLGAALNGSAEYVNSHFKGGSNIQIVDNPDGTQTINASGEVSSEDTVARADIAAIKDGETLDSFGDVETALATKANTSTTYTKTEVDTALSVKANSADVYSKTAVDTALGNKADKSATYTKTEVDTALSTKANATDVYTKTEVDTALGDKVDKETGKGLSTNDYTTAEKTKLDNLAEIKTVGTGLNLDDNGELTATGGGSGGTTNYNDLSNKPQINGNTLSGNKTSAQLGLASASDIPTTLADLSDDSTHRTVSDTEKATWNAKADAGDIPTVPITAIQKNGTSITPISGTVNITVPTTAADVSALPDTTKYAAALSLTINSSTYVMTGQLKDQNGDNLGTAQTIDLPLESVVVGGSYDSQTKKVVLTLQNGNTIEFSVADLVFGLQTELSANNKLNPAYINYDSTHRAVSDTEKSTWNGKQNALSFDGTYSASTNKAATVSTVTNAVNALDVTGDASVSASKTISAWSETDGKVSISTQDIAITGTQATLTGYAKSGTAGQAVAATDNVNQAIGKLEATVDDNKNNISYIAKNNVINTFIRQTGSYTNNGVTFTTNTDGSITLANTATGGAAVLTLSSTLDTTDDTYILYGDGFIDGVYMDTYETGWTNQRTFNSWIDAVPNTKIWRIVVSNGTNADGVTIRPMMCKKSLFDGSYHQYAMSNEQITAWIIAHS